MNKIKYRYFMCDFETTVYDNQTITEVWASACVELFTEDVKIFHSIRDQWEYFVSLNDHLMLYYHNLKFDGNFWLSFLLKDLKFKQAFDEQSRQFKPDNEMWNKTFKYSISSIGQWYTITIKYNNKLIEIRDSLKLLPFSVKRIGESFGTKHKKLDMEYKGYRYAGCKITDEEKEYIANDVLVVKEALEIMFQEKHTALTIGSCCLNEFKHLTDKKIYDKLYPNLSEFSLDEETYGSSNAERYIRKSYKGGWCYVVKGKEGKIKTYGTTADVNSLYPSMMSSESGNYYPIGLPIFWKGNYIPNIAFSKYFFVRLKTRFYIKKDKLPFIQIKGSWLYRGNECLTNSDVWSYKDNCYCSSYYDLEGNIIEAIPELTLTMTDYFLMIEHYDLADTEILDGCYFDKDIGLFDDYINKYKKQKLENKGAKREQAKLFLNNLYGKMATSTKSSFKYIFLGDDNIVKFTTIDEYNKTAGYIAIGSAITSYARNFTIRVAQQNYYGVNNRGFIYADTDSIHCDLPTNQLKGLKIHDKDFCCWKIESNWDKAIFVRQKTYIEHNTHEDEKLLDKPYYNVKCAGMPEKCKQLFIKSMTQDYNQDEYSNEELEFLKTKRNLTDFKVGLKVVGKLMPKRIEGGIVLVDTTYEMR